MVRATKVVKSRPTNDGWTNVYSGLGVTGRDKRLGAAFTADRLDEQTCEEMWLGDDICARIIEAQPEAELRQGFELVVSDTTAAPRPAPPVRLDGKDGREDNGSELAQELMAHFDEREVTLNLTTARQYARAYGGSALLLGAQDGQSFDQPLNEGAIRSVPWLKVLRPRECWPARYYRTRESPKFGEVSHYRVQRDTLGGGSSGMLEVHESRIIPFYGVVVSTRQRSARNSWGDSVLVRVLEKVSDFQAAFQAAGVLVQDFSQAVFKMAGLAELLMGGDDDVIIKRAQSIDMSRSVARALLIDKDEDFERKATPITGLPELLDRLCIRIAAAARMPVTVLMGQSPAGMNATGASDIRNWYDQVAGERTRFLLPRHNRLLRVLMLAADAPTKGKEPKRWSVKYPPLWQMTEGEEADLRGKVATSDVAYINAGVLLPEEVAVSRFGGDKWTMETQLDEKARAAAEAVQVEPTAEVAPIDPKQPMPEDEDDDGEPEAKTDEEDFEITGAGEEPVGKEGIDILGGLR
jgi:phage-related protein (TIGR01555 family)